MRARSGYKTICKYCHRPFFFNTARLRDNYWVPYCTYCEQSGIVYFGGMRFRKVDRRQSNYFGEKD